MYFSQYSAPFLDRLAESLAGEAAEGGDVYCIFDNTGARAAVPDAMHVVEKLAKPRAGHTRPRRQGATAVKRKPREER